MNFLIGIVVKLTKIWEWKKSDPTHYFCITHFLPLPLNITGDNF